MAEAEASDAVLVWEAANRRFHHAITAPCGMQRLLATIEDLQRTSARFLFATWRELDWQSRSEAEHRQILAELAEGHLEPAARALEAHILEAGEALAASLAPA